MRYDEFSEQLKKSCDLTSYKLDVVYNESDSRCWTAVADVGNTNVLVTFHVNRGDIKTKNFDIQSSKRQLVEVSSSEVFDLLAMIVTSEGK